MPSFSTLKIQKIILLTILAITTQLAYSSDNINLQVIDLNNLSVEKDQNITSLILKHIHKDTRSVKVILPDHVSNVRWDSIDLNKIGIKKFTLMEPNTPINVIAENNNSNSDSIIKIKNYDYVMIGGPKLNITFIGKHRGIRGGFNSRAGKKFPLAMFYFIHDKPKNYETRLEFKANIKDSYWFGVDHRGSPSSLGSSDMVVIAGSFWNSGLRMNTGFRELRLDNVLLTDPYGVGFGWDGTSNVKNNGYNIKPHHWERTRGLRVTYAKKITGNMTLEYGGAHWFISTIQQIGESQKKPFHITYKDLGFSKTGTKIFTSGFLDTGGKVDSAGKNPKNLSRYMKFSEAKHKYGYGLRNSVILEATSEDGNKKTSIYFNEGLSIELDNISCNINSSLVLYDGDYSKAHFFSGKMLQKTDSCTKPTLSLFEQDSVNNFYGYSISFAYNNRLEQAASGNKVSNAIIQDGGNIIAESGSTDNHIENVEFKGKARKIIRINNKREPKLPITLFLKNISAPAGSIIEADFANNVSVHLDGKKIELPYIFK